MLAFLNEKQHLKQTTLANQLFHCWVLTDI